MISETASNPEHAKVALAIKPLLPDARVGGTLRLVFDTETHRDNVVRTLVNLLYPTASSFLVSTSNHIQQDDLTLDDLATLFRKGMVESWKVRLRLHHTEVDLLCTPDHTDSSLSLTVPLQRGDSGTLLWLQSSPEHNALLSLLAVPVADGAFLPASFHAIVAIAARSGGFQKALLTLDGSEQPDYTWSREASGKNALPLISRAENTIWFPQETGEDATPIAWFVEHRAWEKPPSPAIDQDWRVRLDAYLASPQSSLLALQQQLDEVFQPAVRWELVDLADAPPGEYMVAPEKGVVGVVQPAADHVVIGADLRLAQNLLGPLLLHLVAHCQLGHIRPGDSYGHWDTISTVTSTEPHRRWDREVRLLLAERYPGLATRKVTSLEECTATEKAQLGLWRMIGEMIGEHRQLHPKAEEYQKAAYQRQAAQRMVAMLEEFGGAMLCDGVGLGKTYIATTLMVHYANLWRDLWAATPERLLEDPFRITVLAPNSVVSTWQREALPPLAAFGVPLATVRVISHTKLSRISSTSEVLQLPSGGGGYSDLEHLLLSDLVIVDEAHNFRSLSASRTKVLRDLLRLQPRKEQRRRVALLTATPINNSLDDLRQEVSLLFSKPLWLSNAKTNDGYRRQFVKEIEDRCANSRSSKRGDVAALVIHGQQEAKFSDAIEFRDDLNFGPNVERIGDYLKEQDQRLRELQNEIRTAAQSGQEQPPTTEPVRIAEDLLDRIVVQRSRALCKEIEKQQSTNIELLFRPDAGVPQKLSYSDEYDGIKDVLARFIPLFDTEPTAQPTNATVTHPLSLKVYMWYDVREGIKSADDASSVVGLQRMLVLKRLESSPVSFFITLLRLMVFHAYRLQQLSDLCLSTGNQERQKQLATELDNILDAQTSDALDKIRSLATGESQRDPRSGFLTSLSAAYRSSKPAADTDDPPPQLSLFANNDEEGPAQELREQLDRLWTLREPILSDFKTLLAVTPGLADIILGRFQRAEWPRYFIAGGEAIDWPPSPAWGLRLVTDAKLRQLIGRLILARRSAQKVIVFSQFSDTIAYIRSVFKACASFTRTEWQMVVRGLGVSELKKKEVVDLFDCIDTITGDTEDRDDVVNAFAPFYRIGPHLPATNQTSHDESARLLNDWEASWKKALEHPIDVLLSSDVLAEGVNLQDVALLINFDVHWNPVRMIQRTGRIDRRLNPRIEQPREFPDLSALAGRLGKAVPRYYWHNHPNEAPVTVNMILPDELEAELQLRERIATKTLAIDVTLGLEQGTGAEAEWMANYKYQGITSLNSFQRDRAIEQIAGYQKRMTKTFAERGMQPAWAMLLNGWFREVSVGPGVPFIGRARFSRRGTEASVYSRYLEPHLADDVPCWLWSQEKHGQSLLNFWLCLDGKNFPAPIRKDLRWSEGASMPVSAHHLLGAAKRMENASVCELPSQEIGRPLMQGITALSAGFLGTEADRRAIQISEYFLLQLDSFDVLDAMERKR